MRFAKLLFLFKEPSVRRQISLRRIGRTSTRGWHWGVNGYGSDRTVTGTRWYSGLLKSSGKETTGGKKSSDPDLSLGPRLHKPRPRTRSRKEMLQTRTKERIRKQRNRLSGVEPLESERNLNTHNEIKWETESARHRLSAIFNRLPGRDLGVDVRAPQCKIFHLRTRCRVETGVQVGTIYFSRHLTVSYTYVSMTPFKVTSFLFPNLHPRVFNACFVLHHFQTTFWRPVYFLEELFWNRKQISYSS